MGISFPYDHKTAIQALVWLLHRVGPKGYYSALKLMWLADIEHLARYGRPIAGGYYCAMPKGPVHSQLYDAVKNLSGDTKPIAKVGPYTLKPTAPCDEQFLSESCIEILTEIADKYGDWDYRQLWRLSHESEAYKRSCPKETGSNNTPIPFEDIVEAHCDDVIMRSIILDSCT